MSDVNVELHYLQQTRYAALRIKTAASAAVVEILLHPRYSRIIEILEILRALDTQAGVPAALAGFRPRQVIADMCDPEFLDVGAIDANTVSQYLVHIRRKMEAKKVQMDLIIERRTGLGVRAIVPIRLVCSPCPGSTSA